MFRARDLPHVACPTPRARRALPSRRPFPRHPCPVAHWPSAATDRPRRISSAAAPKWDRSNPSANSSSDRARNHPAARNRGRAMRLSSAMGSTPAARRSRRDKRPQTLGQRLALRAGQKRMMREGGRRCRPAPPMIWILRRRVRHVVRAAHHMGDPHVHVVHDGGERVRAPARPRGSAPGRTRWPHRWTDRQGCRRATRSSRASA